MLISKDPPKNIVFYVKSLKSRDATVPHKIIAYEVVKAGPFLKHTNGGAINT